MRTITSAQLRKIHVLSRERGLDDGELHVFIENLTKKDSLKTLSIAEAIKVIDSLEGKQAAPAGMITAGQEKFIIGLLKDIGWIEIDGRPDIDRFNDFIRERFNVHRMKWLSSCKASQVIEALKAMSNRKKSAHKEEAVI